jgi:hypothetical protein
VNPLPLTHHGKLTQLLSVYAQSLPAQVKRHYSVLEQKKKEVFGRAHLIVCIGLLCRVLAQDLYYAPPALDPDAGARLAALRIIQPGFELVSRHVDLLVEECDDLRVGFAHRGWIGGTGGSEGRKERIECQGWRGPVFKRKGNS